MQNNCGGARQGAGRKKNVRILSERVKRNYERAAKKLMVEFGCSIEEAFLRMVYDPKVQDSVKASIMKNYNEATLVKVSEQSVDVKRFDGPKIYLPEPMQKPPEAIEKERLARERNHAAAVH